MCRETLRSKMGCVLGVGETDGLGVGDKLAALVTVGVGRRLKYCWETGYFSDLDGQGRFRPG